MTRHKPLNKNDLAHFTGSANWYRHPFNRSITYTSGAQYVAEHGGAYWLLDEIVLAQKAIPAVAAEPFQLWKLVVSADKTATLTCEDGNGRAVFTKQIDYTDFPLEEIQFYFTDDVILLPSEY